MCRWQVQVSVYCARQIHAHLRCTMCSILLHPIDICFLPCNMSIADIAKSRLVFRVLFGPGLVSDIARFVVFDTIWDSSFYKCRAAPPLVGGGRFVAIHPSIVFVYPLTCRLLVGGVRSFPACGPPSSFLHPSGQQWQSLLRGLFTNSRGDNVVHMWVQLER